MRIGKRLGCVLLTLAMCVGLLPGTAWAAQPRDGNLNIKDAIDKGSEGGGALESEGYTWTLNNMVTPKKLNITLKDCTIKEGPAPSSDAGDLILPDGCEITITLNGENTIAGDIKFEQYVTGTSHPYTMTIQDNGVSGGKLTVNSICQSGANKDKLTIVGKGSERLEVTAKSLTLGASGCADSYLEVKNNAKLTITDNPVLLTEIMVTGGAYVYLKKGLEIVSTNPRIFMQDAASLLELGDESDNTTVALKTKNGVTGSSDIRFKNALTDAVSNYLPNNGTGYEVKTLGEYTAGDGAGHYEVYPKGGTAAANYLTLRPSEGGTADSESTPPAPPTLGDDSSSGSSHRNRTRWYEIEPIPSDGCSIDVVEKEKEHIAVDVTVNVEDGYICKGIIVKDAKGKTYTVRPQADGTFQFTMPDKDVTVEAILEKAEKPAQQPIILTIGQNYAWVDGRVVDLDAAPLIRDGRTMLPARFVIEALGGSVDWDADAQKVTIMKDGKTIEIVIGADFATVDGKIVPLDAPAFIENGRTYLPLRFIAENLGASVTWDATTQQVQIQP